MIPSELAPCFTITHVLCISVDKYFSTRIDVFPIIFDAVNIDIPQYVNLETYKHSAHWQKLSCLIPTLGAPFSPLESNFFGVESTDSHCLY